jgi:hypothetical protein
LLHGITPGTAIAVRGLELQRLSASSSRALFQKQFVSWQIGASRRKGGVDQCFGKPIEALAVVYRSQPGFHGIDHFVFDVNYAGYRETDAFTINVQWRLMTAERPGENGAFGSDGTGSPRKRRHGIEWVLHEVLSPDRIGCWEGNSFDCATWEVVLFEQAR